MRQIKSVEKPFDFKALAERLNRVFPDLVRIREDLRAILVMERIKVTSEGVVEGTGLAADKVRAIYEEYMKQGPQEDRAVVASSPSETTSMGNRFRCQHCGIKLTGRTYRRRIGGSILLFCCKRCADHHEIESTEIGRQTNP